MTNSRIRILIAEDHAGYAEALTRMLTKKLSPLLELVEIEHTDRLSEALTMSHRCDVSIIDMELTDSTTEQTLAALPQFRKPVIVLTANYTDELENRCLMADAHAVFNKSDFDKLLEVLNKLIEAVLLAGIHGLAKEMATA